MVLVGRGFAPVEPELKELAEILAGGQHILVPRTARWQLHDSDVVFAAAVTARVRGRFVERRQCGTAAEQAHA